MASSGKDKGQDDRDAYASVHKRGNAVFIINIKPKGNSGKFEFQTRDGANEDSTNLQTVFIDTLGFKWINADCHEDLTTQQWDHRKAVVAPNFREENCKCIRCCIRYTDHSQSEYFVLAISSHGREITETEIIFSDGNSIYLTEIFEAMSDDNCPTLKGKQRIVILQVCRAIYKDQERVLKMQDRGVPVAVAVKDRSEIQSNSASGQTTTTGADDNPQTGRRFRVETVEDHTLQQVALSKMPTNFLLIYPVVSGQKAKRHETDGSWLLHALKKIVQEKYVSSEGILKPVNFLRLLTEVSGYIARERESIIYRERNENQSEDTPENQTQQNAENQSTCLTEEVGQNQSQNEEWVRDEEKSGFKTAVCFHHRLVKSIIFYPEEMEPELPQATISI